MDRDPRRVAGVIVCCDFNATLDQPSAAVIGHYLRPTQNRTDRLYAARDGEGNVSLPPGRAGIAAVDYVWISGRWRWWRAKCARQGQCRIRRLPSNHAGVWRDLRFTEAEGRPFCLDHDHIVVAMESRPRSFDLADFACACVCASIPAGGRRAEHIRYAAEHPSTLCVLERIDRTP